MGPGTTIAKQDKALFDMIAHLRIFDASNEIDIRIADMVAFGMNEESFSTALARAHKRKQLIVLYRYAIEDLCSEEYLYSSPVIARVCVLNAFSGRVPAGANTIGDFAYTENGVGDITLYWRDVRVNFGPKANKVIGFLLKHSGEWKNAKQISSETEASAGGLSELVGSINDRASLKTGGGLNALIECDGRGLYRIDV